MSPSLEARLAGSWKSDERPIDWTDFDHQTIICALDYFHTGHYDPEQAATRSGSHMEQDNAVKGFDVAGNQPSEF